jgi:pyruvate,water dikinase
MSERTLWLEDVTINDIPRVGGKNASLGEMIRELEDKKVSVPGGFCTTAVAYKHYIKTTGLEAKLRAILSGLDIKNVKSLSIAGRKARELVRSTPFPQDLYEEIEAKYIEMCKRYGNGELSTDKSGVVEGYIECAVRSSATAEDLPDASFAGQQETYLNVHGVKGILEATLNCFASLFTDRAISYRTIKGFDHFDVSLTVGFQKMVRSDLACAGVIFTIDTESGFQDSVLITGSYGLGENVVQGTVNPDEYIVFKPTLNTGYNPLLHKALGSKEVKMIYDTSGAKLTKNIPTPLSDRGKYCLSEQECLKLARWACIIEDHYSKVHEKHCPMDIEWAKDGINGELYIVQARPETVQSNKTSAVLKSYSLDNKSTDRNLLKTVITGKSVGEMIGSGKACIVKNVNDIGLFRAGDVLITERTDPDWEPIMKQASAIVTNQGGRTCHAAIIARELGIPAIVGCGNATELIRDGDLLTVSCAEGDVGFIYSGKLEFHVTETELNCIPETKTKIMMNVANPSDAFRLSFIPNKGVGLCRLEFIIANQIKTHPLALLNFDTLSDRDAKKKIMELTGDLYLNKKDYFVDKLSSGIAMLAAAFYPNDVIVRMSDLKSNEYANLIGGAEFEPKEENPMIGWRGASRYYDPKYRAAFDLECQAILKVRNDMGLVNVIPMIPFCRTPEEGRKVLDVMASNNLVQGMNGLQIYVMCEIPSNVILADRFCDVFDGFSIGSNDLTQLTLGIDRDSALVAHIFDERNDAIKLVVSQMIQAAKLRGKKIGICGQAPSDYPDFAKFLVKEGIDSISLNPDSVIKTIVDISQLEKSLEEGNY